MTVAVLRHNKSLPVPFHVEITAAHIELRVDRFKGHLIREKWKHEVAHSQATLVACDLRPLLVRRHEGAIKTGRNAVIEQQLSGEFRRHRGRTVAATNFAQNVTGD